MSRWEPDAAARLHAAAVDLFLEQGFAATTVPQITDRAGLTTRSFFRYYVDKREVLFAGEDELPAVVTQTARWAASSASARSFRDRGLPSPDAELAAHLAVCVFQTALERWLIDEGQTFETISNDVLDALPRLSHSPDPVPGSGRSEY